MQTSVILTIVCVSLAITGKAEDSQKAEARNNHTLTVQEKLKGFESGSVTLEEMTEDGGAPLRQEIIRYYTNDTSRVSVKAKLVVSRCFAMEHDFQTAAQLAEQYAAVYTNDYRGWRILGGASYMLDRNERAFDAYKKAVALGDETSYAPLAGSALDLNRLDAVREIVPQLLRIKNSQDPPKFVKLDIVGVLAIYARKAEDKDVFLKALEGEKFQDILSRDDVAAAVDKTCQHFQSIEVDAICQKVHEAAVLRKDSGPLK